MKSLYIHELVVALCKDIGFHLAQEFYWHNQGKLPTSNWVTVQRVRVKDTIENVLWLSKSPYPKADNRNVLEEYDNKYKKILSRGGYGTYTRPSGHVIDHFNKDNGGRIPSNLIIANKPPKESYINFCKRNNLPVHPARLPRQIAEFFIKMLTAAGDIVWDSFCGSNIVGSVANSLGRRFIANDKSLSYVKGSIGRFEDRDVLMNKLLCS